jgi:growth factor-regulated tyrosine kinase substrate
VFFPSSPPPETHFLQDESQNQQPPKEVVWMSDNETKTCMRCNEPFTATIRRHHCRYCGKLFCNACCSNMMSLPQLGYEEQQRVCDNCFDIVLTSEF